MERINYCARTKDDVELDSRYEKGKLDKKIIDFVLLNNKVQKMLVRIVV